MVCPLKFSHPDRDCEESKCAWWVDPEEEPQGWCAMKIVALQLDRITKKKK